jgi:Ser/Thr protein kinase RdoA (MazF antagonist)
VKAVAHEPNPLAPNLHRREARIVAAMPAAAPVPRLLWFFDEGPEGWVVLALEAVDGREPSQPWDRDELDRVLVGVGELARVLTPSPVETRSAGEMMKNEVNSWHLLAAETPPDLDAWSRRYLVALVELECAVDTAARGVTLVHFDLRADNILLAADRVYFVDWPHACVGTAWVDAVACAPSVAMQGGLEPEELLRRWPGAAEAEAHAITAVLASVAGFFTHRALLPSPPGLPTLRPFQAAQAEIARRWLARRTAWETP